VAVEVLARMQPVVLVPVLVPVLLQEVRESIGSRPTSIVHHR